MKSVGLALGGGGARGIAHIPVLELFDEMGLRPSCIAGTSIGAIIGVFYASGACGMEIRQRIGELLIPRESSLKSVIQRGRMLKWLHYFRPSFGHGGLINPNHLIENLGKVIAKTTFEELEIPLKVVAADYWCYDEVVFESGDLLPAIQASMAIPGVFTPVLYHDRLLMDGGIVNPVPYDLLIGECDLVIAIDITGDVFPGKKLIPPLREIPLHAFQISQQAIYTEKMKRIKPDISIHPQIQGIGLLDFDKAYEVYEQTGPAVAELRMELEKLL